MLGLLITILFINSDGSSVTGFVKILKKVYREYVHSSFKELVIVIKHFLSFKGTSSRLSSSLLYIIFKRIPLTKAISSSIVSAGEA